MWAPGGPLPWVSCPEPCAKALSGASRSWGLPRCPLLLCWAGGLQLPSQRWDAASPAPAGSATLCRAALCSTH